jgi:hypothetical protein
MNSKILFCLVAFLACSFAGQSESGEFFRTFPFSDPITDPGQGTTRFGTVTVQFSKEFDETPKVAVGLTSMNTANGQIGTFIKVAQVSKKFVVFQVSVPPFMGINDIGASWLATSDDDIKIATLDLNENDPRLVPLQTGNAATITVEFSAKGLEGNVKAISWFQGMAFNGGAGIDTKVIKIDDGKVTVAISALQNTFVDAVSIGVVMFEKAVNRGKLTISSTPGGSLATSTGATFSFGEVVVGGHDIEINTAYMFPLNHFEGDGSPPTFYLFSRKIAEGIQLTFHSDDGPIAQASSAIFFTERN